MRSWCYFDFYCIDDQNTDSRRFNFFPRIELFRRRALVFRRYFLGQSPVVSVIFMLDTAQSLYSIDFTCGSEILLMVTMLILHSSPLNARVNTCEQIPSTELVDTRFLTIFGCSAAVYSTTKLNSLEFWNPTKNLAFTRVHIICKKTFFCHVAMIFLVVLLRMLAETLRIIFPRKELFWERHLAYRR